MSWTRRLLVAGLSLLALALLLPPFVHAERYARRIQAELERSLGRRVEILGEVRLNLLTGPGFTAENVVIHDDPAAGVEPFAYVTSLDLTLRLASLWTRRLEFSSLRLSEPTVNLAKAADRPWNVQTLARRGAAGPVAALPEIVVRSGRVNFKFGDVKSPFYLTNVDADIAGQSPRSFAARFSGEPARTDRAARTIGAIEGRGTWRWTGDGPGEMDVRLEAARAATGEMMILLAGRDLGLHGLMGAEARLKGPLANIELTGRLRAEDVARWNLPVLREGARGLAFRGNWDFLRGDIAVDTLAGEAAPPATARFRLRDLLGAPRWAAALTLDGAPAADLVEVMRRLDIGIPEKAGVEGKVSGVLAYSPARGIEGLVSLVDGTAAWPEVSPVRVENARFLFSGPALEMAPAQIQVDDRTFDLEGRYQAATRALRLRLTSKTMGASMPAPVPLFSHLKQAAWRGRIEYRKEGARPGEWFGDLAVENARLEDPGLAEPVAIRSARARLEGERLVVERIQGKAGSVPFRADYRYEPRLARPHRLRLIVEEAEAAEIERLLLPTLSRRQGFLARTLRLGARSAPEWLRERKLEAGLRLDSLWVGGTWLGGLDGHLVWDGVTAEIRDVKLHLEEGRGEAKVSVRLSGPDPEYRVEAKLEGYSFRGGRLDAAGAIQTSGTGVALIRNARGGGTFEGRALHLLAADETHKAAGAFEFSFPAGIPRLRFPRIELTSGEETWQGQGSTTAGGRLEAELANGKRQMRVEGTLAPFALESTFSSRGEPER